MRGLDPARLTALAREYGDGTARCLRRVFPESQVPLELKRTHALQPQPTLLTRQPDKSTTPSEKSMQSSANVKDSTGDWKLMPKAELFLALESAAVENEAATSAPTLPVSLPMPSADPGVALPAAEHLSANPFPIQETARQGVVAPEQGPLPAAVLEEWVMHVVGAASPDIDTQAAWLLKKILEGTVPLDGVPSSATPSVLRCKEVVDVCHRLLGFDYPRAALRTLQLLIAQLSDDEALSLQESDPRVGEVLATGPEIDTAVADLLGKEDWLLGASFKNLKGQPWAFTFSRKRGDGRLDGERTPPRMLHVNHGMTGPCVCCVCSVLPCVSTSGGSTPRRSRDGALREAFGLPRPGPGLGPSPSANPNPDIAVKVQGTLQRRLRHICSTMLHVDLFDTWIPGFGKSVEVRLAPSK